MEQIVEKCRVEESTMTLAQQKCIQHVLRNSLASLQLALELVEDSSRDVAAKQLYSCLAHIPSTIATSLRSLGRGSFCPVEQCECCFLKKHVGCDGKKR